MEAARCLIEGFDDVQAQDQALAAFGLKAERPAAPTHFDLWPENVSAFKVFSAMDTQWHVGPGGAIGLRLETLPFMLEMQGVEKTEWPQAVEGVQVMERETLKIWQSKQG